MQLARQVRKELKRWALREVAWHNPKEVITYERKHKDRLSGLSKRKALKNVLQHGLVKAIP